MKTLVPLILFACSISLTFAQTLEPVESITKGTKFIGGSFGFSTTKSDDTYKSTGFSIGPGMGYYIMDDLALGGFIGYNYSKSDYPNSNSFSTFSGIGLNAFLLKNYRVANNFFFTLRPGLSFGTSKQKYSSESFNYSNFSLGMGISPGIMLFLNKKFALQTSIGNLGYSYERRKPDNGSESINTHNFGVNGTLSTSSFSIYYFIW
ncbi:MAG: outer membrane beta-barrel protein [Cyclobacteriaceae bacterium]|nr:outer membrane beta-barrel protein [Cyclobacteriaceae bacterium]